MRLFTRKQSKPTEEVLLQSRIDQGIRRLAEINKGRLDQALLLLAQHVDSAAKAAIRSREQAHNDAKAVVDAVVLFRQEQHADAQAVVVQLLEANQRLARIEVALGNRPPPPVARAAQLPDVAAVGVWTVEETDDGFDHDDDVEESGAAEGGEAVGFG